MSFILQPWHILLMIFGGLVNQEQQQVIEFQRTHIEVFLEIQGKMRILLPDVTQTYVMPVNMPSNFNVSIPIGVLSDSVIQ